MINNTINNQITKNNKMDKKKKKKNRKRKNYQSNEERKMKDRTPTLTKSFFERKTDSNESETPKKNNVNNINIFIPKNYGEAMNSENTDQQKAEINKELQNLYGNNVMKIVKNKNIPKKTLYYSMLNRFLLLKIMVYIKRDQSSKVFDTLKELIILAPILRQQKWIVLDQQLLIHQYIYGI